MEMVYQLGYLLWLVYLCCMMAQISFIVVRIHSRRVLKWSLENWRYILIGGTSYTNSILQASNSSFDLQYIICFDCIKIELRDNWDVTGVLIPPLFWSYLNFGPYWKLFCGYIDYANSTLQSSNYSFLNCNLCIFGLHESSVMNYEII